MMYRATNIQIITVDVFNGSNKIPAVPAAITTNDTNNRFPVPILSPIYPPPTFEIGEIYLLTAAKSAADATVMPKRDVAYGTK